MACTGTLAGLGLTLLVAACGGGSSSGSNGGALPGGTVTGDPTARGTLLQNPPARLLALTVSGVDAQVGVNLQPTLGKTAAQLIALLGPARCGVDFHYMEYNTVGGAAEKTNATAALMVPTGSDTVCNGARPLLLYAHGTSTDRRLNLADFANPAISGVEGTLAAIYASHGYIVIAPNYAGYDKSRLAYHPFHNADQQSKDMQDALTAARTALPGLPAGVRDNGQIFITGYSQGGYVAMATLRALQQAGVPVTATAAQSGAYAMSAQVDAAYGNTPVYNGVGFAVMLETSWQKAYGDIYASTADIYSAAFAGAEALLPNNTDVGALVAAGRLPAQFQFGTDAPAYAVVAAPYKDFFGPPAQSLHRTSFMTALAADMAARPCPASSLTAPLECAPASRLRAAALKNDLRNWTPASPLLLCGGNADPVVFFQNARLAQGYFAAHGATGVSLVDVDSAAPAGDPNANAKSIFSTLKQVVQASALASGQDPALAVAQNYHTPLTSLACAIVAQSYFKNY